MITFKLTVPQFQQLLDVLLAPEAPDHLSNLVLLASTRPHDGIISVPVPADDARSIHRLVENASQGDPTQRDLAAHLAEQLSEPG